MTSAFSGLPERGDDVPDVLLCLAGFLGDEVAASRWPGEQRLDRVGVLLEEVGADGEDGGRELPARPQVALVDEDLAAAFWTMRVA